MTLIGYVDMKKRKGKVCFATKAIKSGGVGESVEQIFLYDDLADKIKPDSVGKDIVVTYGCGYSGKAFVADVVIK